VWFEHRGYNQRDELIMVCTRVGLMAKSPEHGGSNPAVVGEPAAGATTPATTAPREEEPA
jgi:hypothetical protein